MIEQIPVPFANIATSSQGLTVAPVPLFFGYPEFWTYSHPIEISLSSWSEFSARLRSRNTQRSIRLPPKEILPASEYIEKDEEESIFVGEVNPLILSKLHDLFESTSWGVSDLDGKVLYRLNHLGVDNASSVIDAITRTDPRTIRSLSKFAMSVCQNYAEMGVIQTSLIIHCEGFHDLIEEFKAKGIIPSTGLDNRAQWELQRLGLNTARLILEKLPNQNDVKNINALVMTRSRKYGRSLRKKEKGRMNVAPFPAR